MYKYVKACYAQLPSSTVTPKFREGNCVHRSMGIWSRESRSVIRPMKDGTCYSHERCACVMGPCEVFHQALGHPRQLPGHLREARHEPAMVPAIPTRRLQAGRVLREVSHWSRQPHHLPQRVALKQVDSARKLGPTVEVLSFTPC
jgi:hypothetical protein